MELKKQEKLLNSTKLLLKEKTKRVPAKAQSIKRVKYIKPQPEPESESEEVIIVKKAKPIKKQKIRKIILGKVQVRLKKIMKVNPNQKHC